MTRTFTAAMEGTRAYFGEGRCSGHAQFNGRYCRDVAGPERWCIHCAGYMLVAAIKAFAVCTEHVDKAVDRDCLVCALTAAAEREAALRERLSNMTEAIAESQTREALDKSREREAALVAENEKHRELLAKILERFESARFDQDSDMADDYLEGRCDALMGVVAEAEALGLTPAPPAVET